MLPRRRVSADLRNWSACCETGKRVLFFRGSRAPALRRRYFPIRPDSRINRQIRARTVRLISEKGEQLGVVTLEEALAKAEAAELDLVEVAAESDPPVCRIYDYQKVMYEQKKKLKESRKKARTIELKEIKLRVMIDKHDLDTKLRHAKEFLEKGDKVKFNVQLRGREVTKPEMWDRLIRSVREQMAEHGEVEQEPLRAGRSISFIMAAKKSAVKTAAKATAAPKPAAPKPAKAASPAPEKPSESGAEA